MHVYMMYDGACVFTRVFMILGLYILMLLHPNWLNDKS